MITVDPHETGRNIKRLMDEKNMTVKELCSIMGFSCVQSIYNWFHGKTLPSLDNLVILAHALGVTMDDIIIVRRE